MNPHDGEFQVTNSNEPSSPLGIQKKRSLGEVDELDEE